MARYKTGLEITTDEDDDTWREAVALLRRLKVRFWRPNKFQLKIGDASYYPGKGTIYVDLNPKALPERGLKALEKYLSRGKQVSHAAKADNQNADLTVEIGDLRSKLIPRRVL
jgi:hypothetical protein